MAAVGAVELIEKETAEMEEREKKVASLLQKLESEDSKKAVIDA